MGLERGRERERLNWWCWPNYLSSSFCFCLYLGTREPPGVWAVGEELESQKWSRSYSLKERRKTMMSEDQVATREGREVNKRREDEKGGGKGGGGEVYLCCCCVLNWFCSATSQPL